MSHEMSQEDAFELFGCGRRGLVRAQYRRFVRLMPARIESIRKRMKRENPFDREDSVDGTHQVLRTIKGYELTQYNAGTSRIPFDREDSVEQTASAVARNEE